MNTTNKEKVEIEFFITEDELLLSYKTIEDLFIELDTKRVHLLCNPTLLPPSFSSLDVAMTTRLDANWNIEVILSKSIQAIAVLFKKINCPLLIRDLAGSCHDVPFLVDEINRKLSTEYGRLKVGEATEKYLSYDLFDLDEALLGYEVKLKLVRTSRIKVSGGKNEKTDLFQTERETTNLLH